MISKFLMNFSVITVVTANAGLGFANLPFGQARDVPDKSTPLGVDVVTETVSIDDLPVAKDAQKEYEPYLDGIALENRLKGDIDGDGKDDIVAWKEFAHDGRGSYYQLIIIGSDGTLLWKGPKDKNINNRMVFGDWDTGISMPQVLADIDGDCQVELLAPVASSEMSPQYFKRLKWDKNMMVALQDAILMRSKRDSKDYIWVKNYKGNGLNTGWVMNLYPAKVANEAKADIVYMDRYGNATFNKVLIKFNSKGATIKRVIKKGSI